MRERPAPQVGVDHCAHGAEFVERHYHSEKLGAVFHHHAHRVPGLDTLGCEVVGVAVGEGVELAPREFLPFEHDRRAVAEIGCVGFHAQREAVHRVLGTRRHTLFQLEERGNVGEGANDID